MRRPLENDRYSGSSKLLEVSIDDTSSMNPRSRTKRTSEKHLRISLNVSDSYSVSKSRTKTRGVYESGDVKILRKMQGETI